MTIFEQYSTATWKVGGKTLTFGVERIEERHVNRIIQHKRIYRPGARLDDTSAEAKEWTVTVLFYNDEDQEEGIDGATQYPDNCNAVCDTFDVHEVGDLTLATTRGPRRARAQSYTRIESYEKRDAAACTFVWVEDSEDDAAAARHAAPSAKSQNISIAKATDEALEGAGVPKGSLNQLANDLQGLAEAPGEYVSQFEARVASANAALAATEAAYSKAANQAKTEAEALFTDPANSRAVRLLRQQQDNNARMFDEVVAPLDPPIITVKFEVDLSIYDIATKLEQDAIQLSQLNPLIDDLLFIEAGTPVRVFDAAA